jgi:hypothetical protein
MGFLLGVIWRRVSCIGWDNLELEWDGMMWGGMGYWMGLALAVGDWDSVFSGTGGAAGRDVSEEEIP